MHTYTVMERLSGNMLGYKWAERSDEDKAAFSCSRGRWWKACRGWHHPTALEWKTLIEAPYQTEGYPGPR